MNLPKVYNLKNDTWNEDKGDYNSAANQHVIETEEVKVFQSYDTRVCYIDKKTNKVYLVAQTLEKVYRRENPWDEPPTTPNSTTTRKHLYIFLRNHAKMAIHSIRDLKAYVKAGRIIVVEQF